MKIGIDARFLTHPQEGGFKSYSDNLIRGLCEIDTQNEYVLHVDREPLKDQVPVGANVTVRVVDGANAIMREQYHLPKAMKQDKLDLAHFLCNTAPLAMPIRSVLTIHDLIPCKMPIKRRPIRDNLLQRYWRGILPMAAKHVDHIITVSQSSKADICTTFRLPSKKVSVIPTGFHPAFRPVPSERESGLLCARLGLVGRFVMGFASSDPRKNVQGFLTAMVRIREKVPDCRAVMVCSSEAVEDQVRILAQGVIEEPALTLVTGLTRDELVMVYNLAEVVLFPSLFEGFGLPVVEAMACGTPVVTSNISSLPEVAGDAGILINPKDPAEAADAVLKLLTNDAFHKKKVRQGIIQAQSFRWQRVVQSTIGIYEAVVQGQARPFPVTSKTFRGQAG